MIHTSEDNVQNVAKDCRMDIMSTNMIRHSEENFAVAESFREVIQSTQDWQLDTANGLNILRLESEEPSVSVDSFINRGGKIEPLSDDVPEVFEFELAFNMTYRFCLNSNGNTEALNTIEKELSETDFSSLVNREDEDLLTVVMDKDIAENMNMSPRLTFLLRSLAL